LNVVGSKNLIMGTWTNLPFQGLERFIASLRRTSFDGDVCVFVDAVPPATVKALMAHGVIVERATRFALPQLNFQASRYHNYQEFLGRYGDDYDKVMITDLRDVLFQSDPFATPWPADLVFAQERRRVGDCTSNQGWIAQAYGEAMADNLRYCMISCSGTTFGTVHAMQRYLELMINELASRPIPITGGLDQGVHNYVIRMRPLGNAWCDATDSIVATMAYLPDGAINIEPRGVLIDGRLVPVIHQWDRKKALNAYVEATPEFKLDPQVEPHYPIVRRRGSRAAAKPQASMATFDSIICFYHRERDADWLHPFLATLRAVGYGGEVRCIGAMDAAERAVVQRHGGLAHPVEAGDGVIDVENIAHLHISRVLDEIAASTTPPDQVLVLDTMRAGFLRDPFLGKTIGLSVFCEGPVAMGESEYNVQRLEFFTEIDETWRQRPIISSAVLRGKLDVVRGFYRRLLTEFVGREQGLRVQKMVQGAINKLSYDSALGYPVIIHPNAAEVYFEISPQRLSIDNRLGVRVGGTVPAIVVNPFMRSPLTNMLRESLRL
jgi:hypothetical protein